MLHRIAWTEPARPRGAEDVELAGEGDDDADENEEGGGGGNGNAVGGADGTEEEEGKAKAKALVEGEGDENGNRSLEDNKCWLIWEGALRERLFSGFKARTCPTEREAKELLGDMKGYWDMAKNWKGEEEELF
jgi:U4/U6 small nuclear ribonucleoprotein PRP3